MTATMASAATVPPEPAAGEEQILTLKLDGELFALGIMRVHEVLDMVPITLVPNAPASSPGVINVRGVVVPVLDLRAKLAMTPQTFQDSSRIVVIDVEITGEVTTVGVVADSVHDVVEIDSAAVETIPRIGTRWQPEHIRGIVQHAGQLVVLLDLDRIASESAADLSPGLPTSNGKKRHALLD